MNAESEPVQTISCAKCGHLNPANRDTCLACEKHLWVLCHACDLPNPRENARCTRCYTIIRPPAFVPPPPLRLSWPGCWIHDPNRRWLIPWVAILSASVVPLAVLLAAIVANVPDLVKATERSLFGEIIETMPMPLPYRFELGMHVVTVGGFLVILLCVASLASWFRKILSSGVPR